LEAVDYLIFRQEQWDGAVCMPELDCVGDDLALGVTLDQLEASVRIQCQANVEAFLGMEVSRARGGRFGVYEDPTTLVVFYPVIYQVITKFYLKPLIWARVAVKCTIAVKLPPLLAYPTLPYLTAVQKSVFQYHQKSTEQQQYLQRNNTNNTIVCGKTTVVSALWRWAARRRQWWR
jgi:hypothetical protein